MTANAAASLLEIERDRLLGALSHLERSVVELKEAIVEQGPDQEYKDAINENVVVIAKHRARIASIEDEIKRAKGIKGDISMSQLAAVPVHDDDVDMSLQRQQEQQHRNMMPTPPAVQPQPPQQQAQQQQAPQQQQQQAAASQENGSSGTAMEVDSTPGTAGAADSSRSQAAPQQDSQAGGVWL